MKILFIHCNFPGQFAKLAPFLGSINGVQCVFITQSDNPQNLSFEGVDLKQFQLHRSPRDDTHPYLVSTEQAVLRGQAIVRAIDELIQTGFKPDIAIVHGGQGFGLFLKECFPWLRVVSYMEWYFQNNTSYWLYKNYTLDLKCRTQVRNWVITQELIVADDVVVPTTWQASQFPAIWQNKITQIFDGIDTHFFKKPQQRDLSSMTLTSGSVTPRCFIPEGSFLLTYATRGMEPLRGFPEFMTAAAYALQSNPNLYVVVAGNDRVAYSYESQHPSGSWKKEILSQFKAIDLDLSRIYFPGLINYGELLRLFHRSNLHCYFTRPYVMSWSLYQAASSGTPLLINQCKSFDGIFLDKQKPPSIDLDCQDQINQMVCQLLFDRNNSNAFNYKLRHGYDLSSSMKSWFDLLFNRNKAT